MTLPAKFVERVLRDLGGTEGAALCAALDAEPPVSVRLNPAKTGADTLPAGPDAGLPVPEAAGLPALAIAGRVPWSRDGRYLAVRPSFTLDPDFHAGAYYVQEASSQVVGRLLGDAGQGVHEREVGHAGVGRDAHGQLDGLVQRGAGQVLAVLGVHRAAHYLRSFSGTNLRSSGPV